MTFYVQYNNEIYLFKNLCAALTYKNLVGGELFFTKPKTITQGELFNE